MQHRMENFFVRSGSISPSKFSKTHKTCFVYDPVSYRAYFDYYTQELVDTHDFVTECNVKKSIGVSSSTPEFESSSQQIKMKLYYKKCANLEPDFATIVTNASIPLLKSNLQKAIRQQNINVAVQSALALSQKDPIELARRLCIIEIEDVCLFDHYPILVWLTMAEKKYKWKTRDQYILLCIVATLCKCNAYYQEINIPEIVIKHESVENTKIGDVLLSLLYRCQYGGMKGDIQMLKCGLAYYTGICCTETTDWDDADDITEKVPIHQCEILLEAIDFHPFPFMLQHIGKQSSTPLNIIKEVIWNGESSYNTRKPDVIKKVKMTRESFMWKKIKPVVDGFRYTVLREIGY